MSKEKKRADNIGIVQHTVKRSPEVPLEKKQHLAFTHSKQEPFVSSQESEPKNDNPGNNNKQKIIIKPK